jgi:hypothetical protein
MSWANALIWGSFIGGVLLSILFIAYTAVEYSSQVESKT